MELDTYELFCCLAHDCNYHDEKLCDILKADCIARDYILLTKLRSSWRFLKFSEASHLYSNHNFYIHNHFSQKAKGEISNWDPIVNHKTIQVQAMFLAEKTPWLQTPMTRNSTAIMPMDIHKQAIETKKIGKLNLKDKLSEQKQREAPWDFVYTPSIEHWFIQTSFYCGFDRYKVKDCFRVQLVNWRLLLFH